MKNYLKIARFDHWIKQLFILPGVFVAIAMAEPIQQPRLSPLFLGFFATCFAASANYVINEWLDRDFDQFHPVKKNRPCVAAGLNPRIVYLEYSFLAILSLVLSFSVNRPTFFVIFLLLIMGVVYNVWPLRSKDIAFVDVLTESLNNALRFLIGWFILLPQFYPPVSIVFGYWMAGAFLMAAKRFSEYKMIGNPETARLYRKSFGRYTELSLLLSAIFYAFLSVFFIGVFLIKYRIELLLTIPFICGLFCYYLAISFRYDSAAQKPEKLFHEKSLMLFVAFIIVLFIVLLNVRIPQLSVLVNTELVRIP